MPLFDHVTVKTRPAGPVLTAADMRARLRLDGTEEDDLLAAFIGAATAEIDGPTGAGLAMLAQVWTLHLNAWPWRGRPIVLPGAPIRAVEEIRYIDLDGADQILDPAEYQVRLAAACEIRPATALGYFPAVEEGAGAIAIDYRLGVDTPAEIDPGLVTACALIVGHYFEHREAVIAGTTAIEIPLGAMHILNRYRQGRLG